MDFGGTYILAASRDAVWRALNDAVVLQKTIPGCKNIVWRDATSLDLAVQVNFGVAHPVFTGELVLSDVDPACAYTLSGRAHGKLLGKAHGSARVKLSDHGDSTLLDFRAEGGASQRLLALGKPLIGSSVQRVIDHFFTRFADVMQVSITPVIGPNEGPSDGA